MSEIWASAVARQVFRQSPAMCPPEKKTGKLPAMPCKTDCRCEAQVDEWAKHLSLAGGRKA